MRKKTFEKTIKLKSLNFPKVNNNKELLKYLKKDDQFTIFSLQDILYAVPKDMDILVQNFAKNNTILHAGIEFAQQKGRDFLPQSGLALSKSIDLTQINVCDVDKEIAIRFLQKENISINSEKGFVLISYQNVPLGWVKNLGNRSNNLYPKEWRIRNKQIF